MKIERIINGQTVEFELTSGELFQAHKEYEKDCHKEDVLGKLKSMLKEVISDTNLDDYCENEDLEICIEDKAFDEAFVKHLVSVFENNLSKNDGYYESFWETVKQTLEDEISDKSREFNRTNNIVEVIKNEEENYISVVENKKEVLRIIPETYQILIYDLDVVFGRENRDYINNLLIEGGF